MDMEETMNTPPVLLLGGSGRTGTNILKDIFRDHPDGFGLPFETRFTVDPDGVAPTFNIIDSSWSPFVAEKAIQRHIRFLERVRKRNILDRIAIISSQWGKHFGLRGNVRPYKEWELEAFFTQFQKHSEKLKKDLCQLTYNGTWAGASGFYGKQEICVPFSNRKNQTEIAFRNFLSSLYSDLLTRNRCSFYIDDNTFNSIYAQTMLKILPEAKLVNVVRDPRDVVASYIKQRWTPTQVDSAIKYHLEVVHRWFEVRQTLNPDQFIEVRLEDLVQSPQHELARICDLMEIEFNNSLLETSLNDSNSGRWTKEIPSEQHKRLNQQLSEIISEYGYD